MSDWSEVVAEKEAMKPDSGPLGPCGPMMLPPVMPMSGVDGRRSSSVGDCISVILWRRSWLLGASESVVSGTRRRE